MIITENKVIPTTTAPATPVRPSALKGVISDHLNLARGLAALAVLITHVRSGLFVDYSAVNNPNSFVELFYLVSGFGYQAVIVFFVLSGFFITSSVVTALKNQALNWKIYLIARFSRLWIVLIPALLLGTLWDGLGINIFGKAGTYGSNLFLNEYTGISTISDRFTAINGLGNALFLQRILVPGFGSNDALWSLSYEFWYYLLFPLLLVTLLPWTSFARRIITGLAFLAILVFVGYIIALYFLIWLMGAVLVITPLRQSLLESRWKRWLSLAVTIAGIGVSLIISRTRVAYQITIPLDFLLSFFTALTVYVLFHFYSKRQSAFLRFYKKTANLLASFSYTLYLVHLPLLTFLREAIIPAEKWQPTFINLGWAFLIALLILVYAFVISRLTEARTDRLRNYLIGKLK